MYQLLITLLLSIGSPVRPIVLPNGPVITTQDDSGGDQGHVPPLPPTPPAGN